MTAGNPSNPVRAVIICCRADSSATMYKKIVMRVHKLRNRPATAPYLRLVHSVKTNPSGHLRLMIGPRKPKTRSGREDERAYTTNPCTPQIVAI
jgi:hypothetical protein